MKATRRRRKYLSLIRLSLQAWWAATRGHSGQWRAAKKCSKGFREVRKEGNLLNSFNYQRNHKPALAQDDRIDEVPVVTPSKGKIAGGGCRGEASGREGRSVAMDAQGLR